jgi:hypothetical protein
MVPDCGGRRRGTKVNDLEKSLAIFTLLIIKHQIKDYSLKIEILKEQSLKNACFTAVRCEVARGPYDKKSSK